MEPAVAASSGQILPIMTCEASSHNLPGCLSLRDAGSTSKLPHHSNGTRVVGPVVMGITHLGSSCQYCSCIFPCPVFFFFSNSHHTQSSPYSCLSKPSEHKKSGSQAFSAYTIASPLYHISNDDDSSGIELTLTQLPNGFTWQDLKDLIRREASHGIWTDMAVFPDGRTGGKGYARVQRSDEARALYGKDTDPLAETKLTPLGYLTHYLVEDRSLRVHMWDISRSNAEPRFMQCNCDNTSPIQHTPQGYPSQGLEVGRMAMATGWQNVTPEIPQATIASLQVNGAVPYGYPLMAAQMWQARSPPDAALVQAMDSMQLDPQDSRHVSWYQAQYHQCATAIPSQLQPAPQSQLPYRYFPTTIPTSYYTYTPAGTPINTTYGTIRMEARGVFVSGINYKARTKDIQALFGQAGVVSRCELHKDSSTGKSKGIATIQFASSDDAQRAIDLFHGNVFMNMRLHVRRDKEATAVNTSDIQTKRPHEPIIVNGSQIIWWMQSSSNIIIASQKLPSVDIWMSIAPARSTQRQKAHIAHDFRRAFQMVATRLQTFRPNVAQHKCLAWLHAYLTESCQHYLQTTEDREDIHNRIYHARNRPHRATQCDHIM
nr:protein hrb1 [Quercus suber]